ncbi:MAG TPA: choice-of-anchor tandem repeat GloVer-containing protein [Candidatus Acidoferrales bacterium]|nr:choice-of-anchor tandem repeat GloVer-containing protein [Candidatus Acidoferrales bacterium]
MNRNHRHLQAHPVATKSAAAVALSFLTLLFLFVAAAIPAQAQTPTVIHDFANGTTDACAPQGNIVQGRDGDMYGVGVDGGFKGCGADGYGAVYKISPSGVESIFFNFPAGWDNCASGLTLGSDGNFYGACVFGNPATGHGSLYRLTPSGVFTDLHDFTVSEAGPQFPPIQASDGNFYGVLSYNSGAVPGSVYKFTPAGVFTTIHTFGGGDASPASNLFQASDGNLYGTVSDCSLTGNRGCVYRIGIGGAYKLIYGFVDATGWGPCTGVIQGKNGDLYGATVFGASTGDQGAIYKLTTGGVFTELHAFDSTTDGDCNTGALPSVNLLQVTDGNFYGVNLGGGIGNGGSIYKVTSADVFSTFLFPSTDVDGVQPNSTPIQHTNGLVYGTATSGGGTLNCCQGSFFRVATGDAPFVNLEPTEKTGNVGASVGMFGQGFSSASVVKFGGVAAKSKTLTGTTYLTAVVPAGAHTGTVTVTTGTTTLTSPQTYKVKPKITSLTPSSGPPASLVTLHGTGLIQATTVKFGTVKAARFTVVSDVEVTADVPSGLAAGAVVISITTPGGTAGSLTKFTVQ